MINGEIKEFAQKVNSLYLDFPSDGWRVEQIERLASEFASRLLEAAKEKVDARGDELQEEALECGCYKKLWAAASDIKEIAESLVRSE